jgi:sulfonate transport system substrate-binding protein
MSLDPAHEQAPRSRWRGIVVAIVLIALLAGGLYAWRERGGAGENVLRVGSQRGGTKALLIASGALEGAPYRVEWSEFPAAQNLQEAIGAGAIDLGLAGDAPFQFAYQSGQPIRAVAALAVRPRPTGVTSLLVPKGSSLHGPADLKGRKIATGRGSIGHYLLLRVLEGAGLKLSDVQISFLSPGDSKAAFDSGAVDAWSTWSPYVPTALATGARIIADSSSYFSGYGFDVANAQSAVTKRAILTDYLKREARAYEWAKLHPQDYAKVLSNQTGLPYEVALYQVNRQRYSRVPIDDALKAQERDVVAHFRAAGALAGSQPLDGAYLPLDQGGPPGN